MLPFYCDKCTESPAFQFMTIQDLSVHKKWVIGKQYTNQLQQHCDSVMTIQDYSTHSENE